MTKHAEHRMHVNSLEAYDACRAELDGRAALVLDWIEQHGDATDREVMHGLGFTDPNKVRPRITELVERGMLEESTKVREEGRMVRRTRRRLFRPVLVLEPS